MDSPECYFNSISVDLQRKRDYLCGVLSEVGINPVIPEGGYFVMADWSQLG
jgi:kynurenine--oxoglutarate transaminase/cysteine-S-conjugate beta-lyase/glutamine--phenylpyruvate transaminase